MMYGWLGGRSLDMFGIDVGFVLSYDVCPVIGMSEGIVRLRVRYFFGSSPSGGKLVRVDVEEFELDVVKRV